MSVTKVGPMRSRDQGEAWSRRALLTLGLGDRWLSPDRFIQQVTYWLPCIAPCSAPYEASLGQCSHQVADMLLLGKIHVRKALWEATFPQPFSSTPFEGAWSPDSFLVLPVISAVPRGRVEMRAPYTTQK